MTIEHTHPIAGYRITEVIDGRYVSRLYLGYTRIEAIKAFMSSEY